MLLFILIVLLEMLVSSFRGTKKNIVRLICNIISAAAAGLITYLLFNIFSRTISDITNIDLTLKGKIDAATAETADQIATVFGKGAALAFVYSVLFLIIKYISMIITAIAVKDNSKKGFNPLGLILGFVTGIICAGFVLMPLTGLQQIFPDRETAVKTSEFVSEKIDTRVGTAVKLLSGPTAERVSRYTGIGLLTDRIYNLMTTAKTDSGKECLAEFVPPYLEKIDEIRITIDGSRSLSERAIAGSKALRAFSKTVLFTEDEKISMIENIVRNLFPSLEAIPEYKRISHLSDDLATAGKIIELLEGTMPSVNRGNILDSFDPANLNLSDEEIEKLADLLYSMHAGEFYVNYIVTAILQDNADRLDMDDFSSSKPAFISLLETAMRIRDAVSSDLSDYSTLIENLELIRDSGLIPTEDYDELIETIRNSSAAGDIPEDVFDSLFK